MDAFNIDASAVEIGDFTVPAEPIGSIDDDIPADKTAEQVKVKDTPLPDDSAIGIPAEKEEEEEITKETEDKDIEEGNVATSTDSSPNNPYSSFAKTLADSLPYLDLEDKEIKTAEDLVNFYEESIEGEVAKREFSNLNDNQKYYLEALKTGVPEQNIQENISFEDSINNISREDIEADPELRKSIIKQAFLIKGFNEVEAEKQVSRSINVGEDIDDAIEYQGALSKYVADKKANEVRIAQEQQAEAQKKLDEDLATLKSRIEKPDTILPGTSMTAKFKTELYDMITKPAGEVDGRQVNWLTKWLNEDPINNQLKLAYLFKTTDGFKSAEIASPKKTRSKAVKDLDRILNSTQFDDAGQFNPEADDDNATFGTKGLQIDLD